SRAQRGICTWRPAPRPEVQTPRGARGDKGLHRGRKCRPLAVLGVTKACTAAGSADPSRGARGDRVTLHPSLFTILPEHQRRVDPAAAEGVGDGVPDLALVALAYHIGQVAVGAGLLE